jgi:hypothetical protein
MLKRIYRFEIDREASRDNQSVVYEARDQLDDSAVWLYEWEPEASDAAAAADRFSQVIPSLEDVEAFTSETHFYLATKSREQALAALPILRGQRLFTGAWPGMAPPPVPPAPTPAPSPLPPGAPPVTVAPPPIPTPAPVPVVVPVKPGTGGGKELWASIAVILALGGVLGYVSYQRSQEEAERARQEKAREEQVRKDRLREEARKRTPFSRPESPVVNIEKKKTFDELFPAPVTPPSPVIPPPPAPAVKVLAVCIQNPTNADIVYQFAWSGQNETHTLKKGESQVYDAPFRLLLEFRIDFDNSFAAGYTGTRLVLPANEVAAPATCDKARQYYFSTKGQQIGLVARTWTPGFSHPFAANVVQSSSKEGSWVPASGYRWYNPKDPADLNVVPSDAGLIGVAISKDEKSRFCAISSVRPDGPAANVNLHAGLEIHRVGGVIASGWTVDQCRAAIRGPINSTVSLEVYDPVRNMSYTVSVVRQ